MIDHVTFAVSDYEKSKAFYVAVLATLGHSLLHEYPNIAGFGTKKPEFWISSQRPSYWTTAHVIAHAPIHVAFIAKDREEVDAFFDAAIKAGANDFGSPGVREIYHPNYYGAFVLDPDGNNVEAVCHLPV